MEDVGEDLAAERSFVPPMRSTVTDAVLAVLLGIAGAVLAYWLSYRGLPPEAWADCTSAAGIRTPRSILPGLWTPCARALFNAIGIDRGLLALTLIGKALLGVVTGLGYLIFKEILAILIRQGDSNRLWSSVLCRCAAAVTALLFLCADPVWTLGASFSPALLAVTLFSLALFLLTHFLCTGSVRPAYAAMFLLGLLGAETPLGLLTMAFFWISFYLLLHKGGLFHVRLLEPLMQQRAKWFLTFFWAVGLIIGVTANIITFRTSGAMAQAGLVVGDLPLHYGVALWHELRDAAGYGAWIVGVGAAALLFTLSITMLRRATDLDYFLPYHVGIVFFFTGCIAYSQVSSLYPVWFWTLGPAFTVTSRPMLFLIALACSISVLCSLAVVAADAFCRDHGRLAAQVDPEFDEKAPATPRRRLLWPTLGTVALALLLLAGSIPGRSQPLLREASTLVDDYVREVVTEAGDVRLLFSDGHFDAGVELESARRGGNLRCLPLQPAIDGRRGDEIAEMMEDEEDRLSARLGAANLLAAWTQGKREKLNGCALQAGLEYWRQRAHDERYPATSGVLSRPGWTDRQAVDDGILRTLSLIERVLRLYQPDEDDPTMRTFPKNASPTLRHLFLCMQWRLARMARLRSDVFGSRNQIIEAEEETKLADTLDARNESLRTILASMTRLREYTMRQMTPREGLRFALIRADFALAHRYGDAILDGDGSDPDAHFGIGMDYLMQEQYNLAEPHLTACLERRPMEPAIWNNLAILQYRQKRYDEARANAEKALSLAPRSKEILDTLIKIKKAIDPDYRPENDTQLAVDPEAEMRVARDRLSQLKRLLNPRYNPQADRELEAATVTELAALTDEVAALAEEAARAARTAKEAVESKDLIDEIRGGAERKEGTPGE